MYFIVIEIQGRTNRYRKWSLQEIEKQVKKKNQDTMIQVSVSYVGLERYDLLMLAPHNTEHQNFSDSSFARSSQQ